MPSVSLKTSVMPHPPVGFSVSYSRQVLWEGMKETPDPGAALPVPARWMSWFRDARDMACTRDTGVSPGSVADQLFDFEQVS